MREIILDTQHIKYNINTKIAATSIEKPFMAAGKKLGWRWKSPGIGLNLKVIQFLLHRKFTLVLYIESYDATYFLKHDHLLEFLRDNVVDYKIKDTVLKVIPIEIFTTFNPHTA
jgi:hypothetical protein